MFLSPRNLKDKYVHSSLLNAEIKGQERRPVISLPVREEMKLHVLLKPHQSPLEPTPLFTQDPAGKSFVPREERDWEREVPLGGESSMFLLFDFRGCQCQPRTVTTVEFMSAPLWSPRVRAGRGSDRSLHSKLKPGKLAILEELIPEGTGEFWYVLPF